MGIFVSKFHRRGMIRLTVFSFLSCVFWLIISNVIPNELLAYRQNRDSLFGRYDMILHDCPFNDVDESYFGISQYGSLIHYGTCFNTEDKNTYSVGYMDDMYLDLLNIEIISGRYPQNPREVLVEEYIYDLHPERKIVLTDSSNSKEYEICGVINNYHTDIGHPTIIIAGHNDLPNIFMIENDIDSLASSIVIDFDADDEETLSNLLNRFLSGLEGIDVNNVIINYEKYEDDKTYEIINSQKLITVAYGIFSPMILCFLYSFLFDEMRPSLESLFHLGAGATFLFIEAMIPFFFSAIIGDLLGIIVAVGYKMINQLFHIYTAGFVISLLSDLLVVVVFTIIRLKVMINGPVIKKSKQSDFPKIDSIYDYSKVIYGKNVRSCVFLGVILGVFLSGVICSCWNIIYDDLYIATEADVLSSVSYQACATINVNGLEYNSNKYYYRREEVNDLRSYKGVTNVDIFYGGQSPNLVIPSNADMYWGMFSSIYANNIEYGKYTNSHIPDYPATVDGYNIVVLDEDDLSALEQDFSEWISILNNGKVIAFFPPIQNVRNETFIEGDNLVFAELYSNESFMDILNNPNQLELREYPIELGKVYNTSCSLVLPKKSYYEENKITILLSEEAFQKIGCINGVESFSVSIDNKTGLDNLVEAFENIVYTSQDPNIFSLYDYSEKLSKPHRLCISLVTLYVLISFILITILMLLCIMNMVQKESYNLNILINMGLSKKKLRSILQRTILKYHGTSCILFSVISCGMTYLFTRYISGPLMDIRGLSFLIPIQGGLSLVVYGISLLFVMWFVSHINLENEIAINNKKREVEI